MWLMGIHVSESDDLGIGFLPSLPLSGCVPLSSLMSLTSVSSGKELMPAPGVMRRMKCAVPGPQKAP